MRYITDLGTRTLQAAKRFPFPALWAFFGSIYCIVLLQVDEQNFWEFYLNEVLTLSLGVSWLMATKFFIEQFRNPKKWWFLNLVTLALLALYYFSLPKGTFEMEALVMTRWLLYLLAGHVFLFFAPFVRHWNSSAFWNYLKDIFIALGRSLLFSGVLYLGLVFALLAIDALFDANIEDKVYGQLFIFCLGIVNTGIYLSDFPRDILQQVQIHYNKPLEVFVKVILLPLIALYLLILYVYSFKILINWELPEGWISNMISVLAILGFIIHIIVEPVRKDHPSFLIRNFHPWFYLLLAPLMLLLFVAVFRRIADYNFTESRYLLMLLAFWILGMLVYLLLSKKKQLRILPISLFLLLLLSSFGPWGAFEVSAKAQLKEFSQLYAEMQAEGNRISRSKADRFENISRYLARRNRLQETQSVLGFDPETAFKDHNDYNIGRNILDSLDFEIVQDSSSLQPFQDFFRNAPVVVELKNYEVFADLYAGRGGIAGKKDGYELREAGGQLEILKEEELLLRLDLREKVLKLAEKYGNISVAEPSELEFEISNDKGEFRIIILNLNYFSEEKKFKLHGLRMYFFYRGKN